MFLAKIEENRYQIQQVNVKLILHNQWGLSVICNYKQKPVSYIHVYILIV